MPVSQAYQGIAVTVFSGLKGERPAPKPGAPQTVLHRTISILPKSGAKSRPCAQKKPRTHKGAGPTVCSAAAAVVAAAAAIVAATSAAAPTAAATAPDDNQQNDDPAAIPAATAAIITTHIGSSYEIEM